MMEELTGLQGWLIFADLIVMVSVILALYILVLNPRQSANRLASLAIAILAINILATSNILRATTYQEAFLPTLLMVAFVPAIGPTLIMANLSLIKPAWLTGTRRWVLLLLMLLVFIPGLLTLADVLLGTSIYYVAPDPQVYTGGFIQLDGLVSNLVGSVVLYTDLFGLNGILIILLIYFGFFDHSQDKRGRSLSRILLAVQLVTMVSYATYTIPDFPLPVGIINLFVPVSYIVTYGIAAFQQLVSSRNVQVGRLQTRLTLLMVVIAIPAFIFISTSLTRYSGDVIEEDANRALKENAGFLVAQMIPG
jgi:hypothetical protein